MRFLFVRVCSGKDIMQAFEAIHRRVSIRKYSDKPVSRALLRKIVDAGRRAPTAMGVEPWRFVVVMSPERIRRLGHAVAPCDFVKEAAACIAVYCKQTKYWLEDGCAATENMLLAVTASGLGACWIAGESEPWFRQINAVIRPAKGYHLVSLVALGWPNEKIKQIKKHKLADVIRWEKFTP